LRGLEFRRVLFRVARGARGRGGWGCGGGARRGGRPWGAGGSPARVAAAAPPPRCAGSGRGAWRGGGAAAAPPPCAACGLGPPRQALLPAPAGRQVDTHQGEEGRLVVGLGFKVERRYYARGLTRVVGIDEVGRGPLAGPVFAAAVLVTSETRLIRGVDDSKV